MSFMDGVFGEDIVLDEGAFEQAIADFNGLGVKMKALRTELEGMMNTLKEGFDTPAGRKFLKSCEENLFKPMDAQELVLTHISETLQESKQAYRSVFEEYEALQATINQAKS